LTSLLLSLVLSLPFPSLDAQQLYRAGRYAEALAEYEAAFVSTSNLSAAALYNAGNCAFRLADFPKAALYYRRAALRNPGDPRVQFNLQLTQQKLGIPPEPDSLLRNMTQAVRQAPPARILAAAVGLEIAALAVMLAFRKRKGLLWTGGALLAAAAAAGLLYADRVRGDRERRGLVLAPEVKVYAEPREDLPVTMKVKVGELVGIAEGSDRWVRIRYGGREGWTQASAIGIVD
jgi:tetratricopeptide (TPR) repeat protein